MNSVGIICEYNPFHNGHLYHLNKVKELFPNHIIILVMSGNFTERGDVSVINKWDKTDIAIHYGIDLVIELPFVFATQSADKFAQASIEILKGISKENVVESIEFMGFVSNICVITNVLLTKTALPNIEIKVRKDCCAGTTPEAHEQAFAVMKDCQITIV